MYTMVNQMQDGRITARSICIFEIRRMRYKLGSDNLELYIEGKTIQNPPFLQKPGVSGTSLYRTPPFLAGFAGIM